MNELSRVRDAFLGFDKWFNDWDYVFKSDNNYPPTNIYKEGNKTVIEMAVAGLSKDKLDVSVENDTLKISGSEEKEDLSKYSWHGISKRSFSRLYRLAEGANVEGATVKDGLLKITLDIPKKESLIKRIEVK